MPDTPNFAAWTNENLVKFCNDSYTRMQQDAVAIEQLRTDLRDAMTLTRKALTKEGTPQ